MIAISLSSDSFAKMSHKLMFYCFIKFSSNSWTRILKPLDLTQDWSSCGWATDNIPCWQLCTIHVCPKDPNAYKKEASLQEKVEEGETDARCCSTWRIDHHKWSSLNICQCWVPIAVLNYVDDSRTFKRNSAWFQLFFSFFLF